MAESSDSRWQAWYEAFEERLVEIVEARVFARLAEGFGRAVLGRAGAGAAISAGKNGLPRASSRVPVTTRDPLNKAAPAVAKALAKTPKQLCPVPGCKNPAAPVYGMVCKTHKGVSKIKIAKYREARRQANLKK
jgi:hypothetical protein